ncbi:MAG: TIM barrel protein [Acidimicrobiales bacterium]
MAGEATDFDRRVDAWFATGLFPRTANAFLTSTLAIVGDVDWDGVEDYLEEAFRRMVALGIELVVFGSGGARKVPEGLDYSVALDQLERFMRLAAAHADSKVVIALEHLREQETNVFNTLAESGAFLRDREIPGVGLVVDVHHLWEHAEEISLVRQFSDLAVHVHVCAPHLRTPTTAADGTALDALLAVLAEVGYQGRSSLECNWVSPEIECPLAGAVARGALERAALC